MPPSPSQAILLSETHAFPGIRFCQYLLHRRELRLEAQEHFNKGAFRNRFYIAAANGPMSISIPLRKGKHEQMPIREVEIAYDMNWQKQAWQTLRSAYQRAPFFEHYAGHLEPFFTRPYRFLYDYNTQVLARLLQLLKWPLQISETAVYEKQPSDPAILDLRNQLRSSARSASGLLPYPQVFEDRAGFVPDLSILDLLFCQGPAAAGYLHPAEAS